MRIKPAELSEIGREVHRRIEEFQEEIVSSKRFEQVTTASLHWMGGLNLGDKIGISYYFEQWFDIYLSYFDEGQFLVEGIAQRGYHLQELGTRDREHVRREYFEQAPKTFGTRVLHSLHGLEQQVEESQMRHTSKASLCIFETIYRELDSIKEAAQNIKEAILVQ
jgi:hypothetical protein